MRRTTRQEKLAKSLDNPHPITARHEGIIRLIAEGLTSRQIADRLKISSRTVEAHRYDLMRRLRVRNVAELLRTAWTNGLLPEKGRGKS